MKICILGGGLSGLAAAYSLCRSDKNEIVIIEKEEEIGGPAASFEVGGRWIPKHYDHIFSHDRITRRFLKRFGLDINFKRIKMGILNDGKIYDFTTPASLLRFNYLSFLARIRYGLFGAYVFSLMNPDKIADGMNAEEWLNKYAGGEVTDKLFYDLYARNKFGNSLGEISAKQFAHRLKAKEAVGRFGYPKEGLHEFVVRMKKCLIKKGVRILKGTVIKIVKKGEVLVENLRNYKTENKISENKMNDTKIKCDVVINTLPLPVFLSVVKGIPKDYRERLSRIKYCSCVCVTYGADSFLSKHYWLNVLMEDIHMIIQHSMLFDDYEDKVGWVLRYGGSEKDFGLSDDEIKQKYSGVVKRYFPNVGFNWMRVFRERYASPIYDKNYFKNKPDYKAPLKWLYHTGIAVTYPKIRNMNTALMSGLKVARIVKEDAR